MILELANINLPLGRFPLQLSVSVEGGITGISGPSGSGKTSFLEVVAGLRRPVLGQMFLHGKAIQDSQKDFHLPPWKREMGYVPQDQALFPHWNVRQNLLAGPGFKGQPLDAAYFAKVVDLLELEPLLTRHTAMLSGGEKGRVALGRALMIRPKLLLLDEPLAHLDDRLRDKALDALKTTAQELNLPILIVSHSARELGALCHRIIRMERGQIID